MISPSAKNELPKELLGPGPSKDFPDFDYKYEGKKASSSSRPVNVVLEAQVKSTKAAYTRRPNRLNGINLINKNLDEFDAVGGLDLFRASKGIDDR